MFSKKKIGAKCNRISLSEHLFKLYFQPCFDIPTVHFLLELSAFRPALTDPPSVKNG